MVIILVYLLLAALLLLLNAFFVLAEFASVRARPTQIEALAAKGDVRAKMFQRIQAHLDQFLSVCQIGITFASIGLGFVGEPAVAGLLTPAFSALGAGGESAAVAHGVAIGVGYALISFLHIVIGEQVPKLVAIRKTEKCALFTAHPLLVSYYLFFVPLWLLNSAVNGILRLFRIAPSGKYDEHSEDEVRLILSRSQSGGLMTFRRLLYMENILDFGALTVRNAMRPRNQVRYLKADAARAEIDSIFTKHKYSRYPLLDKDPDMPLGFIHCKDLFLAERSGKASALLRAFVRPCPFAKEDDPLEPLLSEMQRRGNHMALVYDRRGRWSGIITLEDIVEEVLGTIEEEFPLEPRVDLCDYLSPDRVFLNVEGDTIIAAARNALLLLDYRDLPQPVGNLGRALAEREARGSSYVGKRLAIPHARLKNIGKPVAIVARLKKPIAAPVPGESIDFLFILLTPEAMPRIHQILLSHIAGIFESEFLEARIATATTAEELHEAIRVAEQTALA